MPPVFYPQMLAREKFYLFPTDWLHDVKTPSDLDTRDVLLFYAHDGQVIFPDRHSEASWRKADLRRGLRELFSRPSYENCRNALYESQRIRTYTRVTGVRQRWLEGELQQGIAYELVDWSRLGEPIFRPNSYLENRWPVWLGNVGLESRLILLAFLAKWTTVSGNQHQILFTPKFVHYQAPAMPKK